MKSRGKGYQARCAVIILAISVPFLVSLFVVRELFGNHAAMAYEGGVSALFGCVGIIASAIDKIPNRWHFSERELQEVAKLKGETEDGLHKLADFHLKAGNFAEADACSRKLLDLAERDIQPEL